MYAVIAVVLFSLICNILVPDILNKIRYETSIMSYMKDNNYTSPQCFTKYLASISRTSQGVILELAMKTDGTFAGCLENISSYYRCTQRDYVNILHPCTYVSSNFPLIASRYAASH